MNYYISSGNVTSAIDYFCEIDLIKDNNLFLFLLSKHLGVSTSVPVNYRSGSMTREEQGNLRHSLWMIGGLFDTTEKCGKYGLMFPTLFSKVPINKDKNFYNPGSPISGVHNRVADTIKQVTNTVPMWDYNDGVAILKYNYRELIQEKCLNGNKISLSNLAAWVFRFTAFDFEEEPSSRAFTKVVEKAIRKYFKITKNEFLWLFENDFSVNTLTPDTEGITGQEVRDCFTFDDAKTPEVEAASDGEGETSIVGRELIDRYLSANGENPSDNDILDILKSKKQIVLTGVPGVGKSRYTKVLCNNTFFNEKRTIQFHASYAYEDFIGAEILKTEDRTNYVGTRKGVFLEFVHDAEENKDKNYLFIIDELNRGNIAEIFGETILALDRTYTVSLSKEFEGIKELHLPDNLYIVGTMNTSDRNIAFLDLAIRRRFAFIPLLPNYDFLSEEVTLEDFDLGNILCVINQRILATLKDPELILGQSYFIPPEKDGKYEWDFNGFKNQFNFVLLPTLKEYSFNEPSAIATIVGENLSDGVQDVDEFREYFKAEFSM